MNFTEKAIFLSAISKPYSFQGREGTSHKARFLIGTEILRATVTADQVEQLNTALEEGQEVEVTFRLSSPKEELSLSMVSFK